MTDKKIEALIDKAVKKAFKELRARGALKSQSDLIYKDISKLLRSYYLTGEDNVMLQNALDQLQDDYYIKIIPLYYAREKTIEELAALFGVDVSTITRNKKRLCFEIYELMEEEED